MNKRLEEKLAMLAFGDMSPEEVTRLEQEVLGDREAMLVLEQYRGMRSGLRAMAEIPEHQLSTERLRNAVLNQGLKPKSRPQIGWLWMPTMAAVLAFGFMMIRSNQNAANANVALSMGSSLKPSTNPIDLPNNHENVFALATASGQILSVQNAEQPRMVPVSNVRSGSRMQSDQDRISALEEVVREQFVEANLSVQSGRVPAGGSSEPVSVNAFASTPKEKPAETIILIDSARDNSTGAHKATEVDSTSNVIVGG